MFFILLIFQRDKINIKIFKDFVSERILLLLLLFFIVSFEGLFIISLLAGTFDGLKA